MNTRIKKLRKDKDLTQREFGARLGMKPNSISQLESGVNHLSDPTISAICREFGVREAWLRHGEEPMYGPEPVDEVEQIAKRHGANDEGVALIRMVLALPKDTQAEILSAMRSVLDGVVPAHDYQAEADAIMAANRLEDAWGGESSACPGGNSDTG